MPTSPPRPLFRRRKANAGTPWAILALATLITGGYLVAQEKSGHGRAPLLTFQTGDTVRAIDAGGLLVITALFFAVVGAIYLIFPNLFHRRLNKPLGLVHYLGTILGTAGVLLIWQVRMSSAGITSISLKALEACLALLCFAQAIFLINMVWSSFRGKPV